MNRHLLLAVKLVLTVGLLTYLLRSVDLSDVLRHVIEGRHYLFAVACLIYALVVLLSTLRWKMAFCCQKARTPSSILGKLTLGSTGLNIIFSLFPAPVNNQSACAFVLLSDACTIREREPKKNAHPRTRDERACPRYHPVSRTTRALCETHPRPGRW